QFKNQSITISPSFFLASNLSKNNYSDYYYEANVYHFEESFDLMSGYGGDLIHKFFIFNDNNLFNGIAYAGYGITYRHHSFEYDNFDWVTRNYDGLDALYLTPTRHKDIVDRVGGQLIIGYTISFPEKYMLDIYTGTAAIYSFKPRTRYLKNLNTSFLSHVYTGILPILMIRFGVNL
ncbi:MAG: hypothetical protein ACOCWG_04075, partial [bacterium]